MFFQSNKKTKIKTFDDLAPTKKVKSQGREVIITGDKELLGRMAIIASNRSVDPKEIFSYPLGPIPWSLSGPLGTFRKTSKSVFMLELERHCDKVSEIPGANIDAVIDDVAIMQICNPGETFGSFANQLFKMMMSLTKGMARVDIVFDKYMEHSIKNLERIKRSHSDCLLLKNIQSGHQTKQWKRILGNYENKKEIIKFLFNKWTYPFYIEQLEGKTLFVTCENLCQSISSRGVQLISELQSNHEEADTKMLFHINHISQNNFQSVPIISPVTDVALLCMYYYTQIGIDIYVRTGSGNKRKILRMCDLVNNLEMRTSTSNHHSASNIATSIVGFHAFTGCDSVS